MIYFFNEDFSSHIILLINVGIARVDLGNINLDYDNNFDEDDPETIINVRHLTWCNKSGKHKAFKKDISEELMLITWHPKTWCKQCM